MAKSPTSLSTYDAMLKELYTTKKIESLVYSSNPWLGMIPKNTRFLGDSMVVPVHYGNTNKRSADFAVAASTLTGTSSTVKFVVTRVKDYAVADLGRETLKASEGNEGAFVRNFKFEVDDAIQAATRSLAQQLFGSGTGSKGKIGSIAAGGLTLTLDDVDSVANFEVNEYIGLSATDGASLRGPAYAQISGIDRDLGTLSFAADVTSTISGAVAGDFIVKRGDLNAQAKGLAAWIPADAPSATAFFGVDRTADATRLAGVRVDASSSSAALEEVLIETAARLGREGAGPDVVIVNFNKWQQLAQSLQSNKRFQGGSAKSTSADIGYSSIQLAGPRGVMDVVADHNCPGNRAYVLTKDSWELASLGPATHIFDDDGQMVRNGDSDSYEVRIGGYFNVICHAPGKNAVVKLA